MASPILPPSPPPERHYLEAEVLDLKTDMMGVKTSISTMENTLAVLGEGHRSLAGQVAAGFSSIQESLRESRKEELNKPSVVKVSTLISFASAAAAVFGLAGLLFSMRLAPIDSRIATNSDMIESLKASAAMIPLLTEKAAENKRDIASAFDRADRESEIRNGQQQLQINQHGENIKALQASDTQSLRERVETQAKANEAMRICEELHETINKRP